MSIRIVTDSACDVPEAVAAELGIAIVPVYINIGQESFLDGVQLSKEAFYRKFNEYTAPPTTAAPASGSFAEAYERLAAEGATEILSIHIASSLSNTYNAARLGAEATNVPVTLFDSQQLSLGSGLLAIVAAEAARDGRSMAEIVQMLQARVSRTHLFGVLENLDALRRSGRVSWAQFGIGSLLQIKPILMVHSGEVSVVAKIRTHKRAIQEALTLLEQFAPLERLAVLHAHAPELAEELRQTVSHLCPAPIHLMEISPALGTHFGLGAVGFACISQSGK